MTGVPDADWGERVHAVVVLPAEGHTLDLDELRAFCAERFGGYKIPGSMELVSTLPISATGKVLKRELRKPYWGAGARRALTRQGPRRMSGPLSQRERTPIRRASSRRTHPTRRRQPSRRP